MVAAVPRSAAQVRRRVQQGVVAERTLPGGDPQPDGLDFALQGVQGRADRVGELPGVRVVKGALGELVERPQREIHVRAADLHRDPETVHVVEVVDFCVEQTADGNLPRALGEARERERQRGRWRRVIAQQPPGQAGGEPGDALAEAARQMLLHRLRGGLQPQETCEVDVGGPTVSGKVRGEHRRGQQQPVDHGSHGLLRLGPFVDARARQQERDRRRAVRRSQPGGRAGGVFFAGLSEHGPESVGVYGVGGGLRRRADCRDRVESGGGELLHQRGRGVRGPGVVLDALHLLAQGRPQDGQRRRSGPAITHPRHERLNIGDLVLHMELLRKAGRALGRSDLEPEGLPHGRQQPGPLVGGVQPCHQRCRDCLQDRGGRGRGRRARRLDGQRAQLGQRERPSERGQAGVTGLAPRQDRRAGGLFQHGRRVATRGKRRIQRDDAAIRDRQGHVKWVLAEQPMHEAVDGAHRRAPQGRQRGLDGGAAPWGVRRIERVVVAQMGPPDSRLRPSVPVLLTQHRPQHTGDPVDQLAGRLSGERDGDDAPWVTAPAQQVQIALDQACGLAGARSCSDGGPASAHGATPSSPLLGASSVSFAMRGRSSNRLTSRRPTGPRL